MNKQMEEMVAAAEARRQNITPDQHRLRQLVDERNDRIQTIGVKAPASGTFGKPPK